MTGTSPAAATGTPKSSNSGTGTLGKAISLLESVVTADRPLRFSEILALSVQPRGTLHRQLTHLVDEGLLTLGRDQRYQPGVRLLRFAYRSWSGNQFRMIAEPHLHVLAGQTGETVHLGVLRGLEIIYVDKVESRQAVRMGSQIGNASPVYCTGLGKAALSALPETAREDLLARLVLHPHTPGTHRSIEALRQDLENAHRLGHAFDLEEHEPEIRCVAAPIHDLRFDFVAGVSVTGPAYRVSRDHLEGWAPAVRDCATAIKDDMEIRLGPGR